MVLSPPLRFVAASPAQARPGSVREEQRPLLSEHGMVGLAGKLAFYSCFFPSYKNQAKVVLFFPPH